MRTELEASALVMVTALLATGCEPPEENWAMIEIKTDLDCSALTDVTIDVVDELTRTTVASTTKCSDGRIGSLVFVGPDPFQDGDPSSTDLEPFTVVVTAGVEIAGSECQANGFFGCIVARRRLGYRETPVEILLRSDCLHIPCEASQTCGSGGQCGPIDVDYDACDEVCDEDDLTSKGP